MDVPNFLSQQAHVKLSPEDDIVQISLFLKGNKAIFNRPKEEKIQKTLKRMELTLAKKLGSKERGVSLTYRDALIDVETMKNENLLSGMQLLIAGLELLVVVNPPVITDINVFPTKPIFHGNNITIVIASINYP